MASRITSALKHISPLTRRALQIASIAALMLSAAAQLTAQATTTGGTPPPGPSRFDLYGGYSYIHPVNSDINHNEYLPINPGAVVSVTGYFNRYLGIQAEGTFFPNGPDDCIYGAQAGVVFRYPLRRFVPFAHALGGGAKVGGPVFQPCTWGWGATGGLGFDYILPILNNHLAIRPIQADFDYSNVNYGPLVQPADVSGGLGEIHAYKLSGGLVLRLGGNTAPPPLQLGCTTQPVDVYPGMTVLAAAAPANLVPKKQVSYTWTANGGQITPTGDSASIATTGLAAGDYVVKGHVSQGIRPSMQADCIAGFRVHAYEPPTIACSANPSTVLPGGTSTITVTASSPQNRQLSYSYSASAGLINGNTATATLTTPQGASGTITVTCNVVDDLGKQASSTTSVGINVPPVPVAPSARSLCSVSFDRDRKHPVRVDNEAKGCLDDVALTVNRDSTARLVIIGHHAANESPDAAAERTLNVEQYLVDEKGIDPSRIELRIGDNAGRTVDSTLVPAGATFDPGNAATFDGSTIKRRGQPYTKPRPPKNIRTTAN